VSALPRAGLFRVDRDGARRLRLVLRDRVLEPFADEPLVDVLLLRDPGGEDVRVAMQRP
jgi:hypothetical protein